MRKAILILVLMFTIYGILGMTGYKISITKTDKFYGDGVMAAVSSPPVIIADSVGYDNWETFRKALITVESGGNSAATNKKSKAYGLYQILPKGGYLDQYNKLQKTSYTIDDLRGNPELQHKIFDRIQDWGNPEKDFKRALTIHNSKAMNPNYMTEYEYRVMYHYFKLEYEDLCSKYNELITTL